MALLYQQTGAGVPFEYYGTGNTIVSREYVSRVSSVTERGRPIETTSVHLASKTAHSVKDFSNLAA